MYKLKKFRDSIEEKSAIKRHSDLMSARDCFYKKAYNLNGFVATSTRIDFNQYYKLKELIRNGDVDAFWLKYELEYSKFCSTFRNGFLSG